MASFQWEKQSRHNSTRRSHTGESWSKKGVVLLLVNCRRSAPHYRCFCQLNFFVAQGVSVATQKVIFPFAVESLHWLLRVQDIRPLCKDPSTHSTKWRASSHSSCRRSKNTWRDRPSTAWQVRAQGHDQLGKGKQHKMFPSLSSCLRMSPDVF